MLLKVRKNHKNIFYSNPYLNDKTEIDLYISAPNRKFNLDTFPRNNEDL